MTSPVLRSYDPLLRRGSTMRPLCCTVCLSVRCANCKCCKLMQPVCSAGRPVVTGLLLSYTNYTVFRLRQRISDKGLFFVYMVLHDEAVPIYIIDSCFSLVP